MKDQYLSQQFAARLEAGNDLGTLAEEINSDPGTLVFPAPWIGGPEGGIVFLFSDMSAAGMAQGVHGGYEVPVWGPDIGTRMLADIMEKHLTPDEIAAALEGQPVH